MQNRPRRTRTLVWPHRIPRRERRPLDTGHGSFSLTRVHDESDSFDRQVIRLSTHALVFIEQGGAILECNDTELLLQTGDGALVPPGQFLLTELAARPFSSGKVQVFFFNDRALAEALAHREGMDEIAARVSLPPLPFYPVRTLGAALQGASAVAGAPVSARDFRRIISCVLQVGGAAVWAFLKHGYFVKRFQLCLFLEDYCLPEVNALAVEARYPGGRSAFRRECAVYLGVPLEQWLFRRRMELAHDWLRFSPRPVDEIAARLGYDDLRQFRVHVGRYCDHAVDDLIVLRHLSPRKDLLENACVPSWFPSREALVAKDRLQEADFLWLTQMRAEHGDLTRWSRRYIDGGVMPMVSEPGCPDAGPVKASVENFLDLQTTKVSKIIRFPAEVDWASSSGPHMAAAA